LLVYFSSSHDLTVTKAVISKATFLSLFVIAACPQSFRLVRKHEEGFPTSGNDKLW